MGQETLFRGSTFGGFNRKDVIDYIEKLQKELLDYRSAEKESTGIPNESGIAEKNSDEEQPVYSKEACVEDRFPEYVVPNGEITAGKRDSADGEALQGDENAKEAEMLAGKNAEMSEQVDELTAKNAELSKSVNELTAKNAEMSEQAEELALKNAEMSKQADESFQKNAELSIRADELTERNDALIRLTQELSEKNAELAALAEKLAESNRELENSAVALSEKNSLLKASADKTADLNNVLETRAETLSAKTAELSALIDELTDKNVKLEARAGSLSEKNSELAAMTEPKPYEHHRITDSEAMNILETELRNVRVPAESVPVISVPDKRMADVRISDVVVQDKDTRNDTYKDIVFNAGESVGSRAQENSGSAALSEKSENTPEEDFDIIISDEDDENNVKESIEADNESKVQGGFDIEFIADESASNDDRAEQEMKKSGEKAFAEKMSAEEINETANGAVKSEQDPLYSEEIAKLIAKFANASPREL